MKRIDRALLAEAIPGLVFGAALYAVLAVTSMTLPRLTWLAGVEPLRLLVWLGAQMPTAMAQTMPIAMVLTVLLTFGRMDADREILAVRAGGLSMVRATLPMLALAAAATVAMLLTYQFVTPRTHAWVASEYWRMTSGQTGLFRLAGQALPVGEFSLQFERTIEAGRAVEGVRIERWDGDRWTLVRAREGRFRGDALELTGFRTQVFDFAALDDPALAPDVRLRNFVRIDNRSADPDAVLRLSLGLRVEELVTRFSQGGFEDDRSLVELAAAWRDVAQGGSDRRTAGVVLMRRLAEPFANLVLLLVALPLALGVGARTRECVRTVVGGDDRLVPVDHVWAVCGTVGHRAGRGWPVGGQRAARHDRAAAVSEATGPVTQPR